MRHEIRSEGTNFRLRPVVVEAAAFIVALRTDPARSRFIHPTSTSIPDQEQWLERYYERSGDYYFIIENIQSLEREGTIAIYDLDEEKKCAEWGRWVVRPGSAAAIGSAILIYQIAFEVLNLEMVYCRTVKDNAPVVQFHKSFGLSTTAHLSNQLQLKGVTYDLIEQQIARDIWEKRRAEWDAKADLLTRLSQRDPTTVS